MPPEIHALPPLNDHQVKTLAVLLRRAIANSQLALHEEALDEDGIETEQGISIVAEDWAVDADSIPYADGTPPRFGVHLYVTSADLDALCEGD